MVFDFRILKGKAVGRSGWFNTLKSADTLHRLKFHSYPIKVVFCVLMMVSKKTVQYPTRFIEITIRACDEFLFSAALSDRAVHTPFENTSLRPAAAAIHLLWLQIFCYKLTIKI